MYAQLPRPGPRSVVRAIFGGLAQCVVILFTHHGYAAGRACGAVGDKAGALSPGNRRPADAAIYLAVSGFRKRSNHSIDDFVASFESSPRKP
jgi:hypothetical protein